MKIGARLLVAVGFFMLSACSGTVDVTKTGRGFFDQTSASDVDILKTNPTREFTELGTVTVTGFTARESAKMHNAVRTKAAQLGATAVILTEEGITPGGWTTSDKRWATGVAIRYEPEVEAPIVVEPIAYSIEDDTLEE